MKNIQGRYQVQIINTLQGLDAVLSDWDEFINTRAGNISFWQDLRVVRYEIERKGDSSIPLIVLLWKEGIIDCVMPGVVNLSNFKLSLSVIRFPSPRLRLLKIYGNDFIYSKSANEHECIDIILSLLNPKEHGFDLIAIDYLVVDNPIWKYFSTSALRRNSCYQLKTIAPKKEMVWRHQLASSFKDWLATLRRKTRSNQLRQAKIFFELAPGDVKLEKIVEAESVPHFLELLDRL